MRGGYQQEAASLLGNSDQGRREVHEIYDTSHMFPRMLETHSSSSAPHRSSSQSSRGQELSEFGSFVGALSPSSAAGERAAEESTASASRDSRVGCRHCSTLYRPSENRHDACGFHRGRFSAPATATGFGTGGVRRRWTCCRAEAEGARGCVAGPHEEDPRITHILNSFNTPEREGYEELSSASGSRASDGDVSDVFDSLRGSGNPVRRSRDTDSRTARNSSASNAQGAAGSLLADDEDNYSAAAFDRMTANDYERSADGDILHLVLKSDTLTGLSMKYGVSVGSIKARNRIMSDRDLFMFKKIKIPPPDGAADDGDIAAPGPLGLNAGRRTESLADAMRFYSLASMRDQ